MTSTKKRSTSQSELPTKSNDKDVRITRNPKREGQRIGTIPPKRGTGSTFALELPLFKATIDDLHHNISSDLVFLEKNLTILQNINSDRNITNPELRMLKVLLNFDAFTLQTRATDPTFYASDQILLRFKTMKNVLENMSACLEKHKLAKPIEFVNEPDCVQAFQAIFPEILFSQPYFRKVCSDIYRIVVDNKLKEPSELYLRRFYESIKLFLFGIILPSDYADDYPIHSAIYKSDVEQVRKMCEGTQTNCFFVHIEQGDPMGISPLLLAIKLGNQDIVSILTAHGADPRHKVVPKSKYPMEEAMYTKNKEIIKAMLMSTYQLRLNKWEKTKESVLNFLEKVPDFSFELQWECDSNFIPFVSKLAPSDTNKIYKKGTSLRMDATIAGINKLKVTRGNISLFLLGKEHPGYEGKILLVNHGKKTITDLMTEIDLKHLEKQVDLIAKQSSLPSEVKPEDIQFEPAKSWRGEPITEKIQNYQTVKYNAKGTLSLLYTKKVNDEIDKFGSYEAYFESTFPMRYWAPTSFDNLGPFDQVRFYVQSNPSFQKKLFDTEVQEEVKQSPEIVAKFEILKNSQNKLTKETKKNIDASIWLADSFPLHSEHLLAILDVMSSANPNISKLKEFLEKKSILHNRSFPLKAVIPLYLSVSAVINFRNFVFKSPDSSLFDPPKSKDLMPRSQIAKLSPTSNNRMKLGESFSINEDKTSNTRDPQAEERKINEINIDDQRMRASMLNKQNSDYGNDAENFGSRLTSEVPLDHEVVSNGRVLTPKNVSLRMERYSTSSKRNLKDFESFVGSHKKENEPQESNFKTSRLSYNNSLGIKIENDFQHLRLRKSNSTHDLQVSPGKISEDADMKVSGGKQFTFDQVEQENFPSESMSEIGSQKKR